MPIDLSGLVVLARVCICNHGVEVQYGINQKAHVLAAFCFMMIRCFSAAKRWIWRGVKAMRHSDCPSHGRDDRQIRQIKKSAKRSFKKNTKNYFPFFFIYHMLNIVEIADELCELDDKVR